MSKLRKIVKNDFENKLDKKLVFDTAKLESNPKKFPIKKFILINSFVLIPLLLIAYPILKSIKSESSFKNLNKKYSLNEIRLIEESSFKKINDIAYPTSSRKNLPISEEYKLNMQNFTNEIYHNLDNKGLNFSCSPMGLYSSLHILSYASESAKEELDSLLGLTSLEREEDFKNMFKNNYFSTSEGTVQLNNAMFLTNKYDYNEEFVNHLTSNFVEAYQLDFKKDKDIEKMLKWVDEHLKDKNTLKKEDLNIEENTALYLLSSLYFDNEWMHKFPTSNSKIDDFYFSDGSSMKCKFMNSTYYGDVYDYGNFVSCFNYYKNGLKIEYFVPKNVNDNIYDLVENVNLFNKENAELYKNTIIDLSVPTFNSTSQIDFRNTLEKVGLINSFNPFSRAFNKAFIDLPSDTTIYLDSIKQKNKISFTENGTIIKSLSISIGACGSAAPTPRDGYDIDLNQPFIYVIYDNNDLPLFLGSVDNPNL